MGRGLSGGGGPRRLDGRRKAGLPARLRLPMLLSAVEAGHVGECAVVDEGVVVVAVPEADGSRGFGFGGGGAGAKGRSLPPRMGDAGPRSLSGFGAGEMGRLRGVGRGEG